MPIVSTEPQEEALRRELERLRQSEAAQRAETVRLREAVDGAGLATWEWTVATGKVVHDRRFVEMLGCPSGDTGTIEFWRTSLHPEDAPPTVAALDAYVEGRSSHYQAEYRLRHRDGSWVWILALGQAAERGPDGRALRICGMHEDIGERKRLEAERARLEGLLGTVVDSTDDMIWSVEAEDHRLVTYNRAFEAYMRAAFGTRLRVGMSPEEMAPPPVVEEWIARFRRAHREGAYSVEYETRALGLVLDLHVSPVVRDGRVVAISIFGRDVTERRRAAERLASSEAFYRALLEQSPDVAAVIGPDGRFRFVSPSCTHLLGYTQEELLARGPLDLAHPGDAARMTDAMARVMGAGPTRRSRYRFRHRDGSWRHLESLGRNLLDHPDVAGLIVNTRDVTEQVLLSARLQEVREEEKARIARDLHDQLGQLLTGLKLDLLWLEERLEAMPTSPAVNALIERAVGASELSERLVAEVQRIATDLRPAALDRLGLGAALRQEARRFEKRTGVRCRVEEPVALPALPPAVAVTLYRIAQEALTNVARHARARSVSIRLEAGRDRVAVAVEDDGVGIDPARAEDPGALGLAGMRERATLEGGELLLARRREGGTRVEARLPLPEDREGGRPGGDG